MEKILVSACLIGDNTRFDGKNCKNDKVLELNKYFDFIVCCPEVQGGLRTPRPAIEIRNQKAMNILGDDVTKNISKGVDYYTSIIRRFNIKAAILKDLSPSCGSQKIYDGSFRNRIVDGQGMFAQKLRALGLDVYSENNLEEFKAKYLNK